jgi:sugar O-acyltransferase (sialic acid O-acetyltransferase NeuD family)
VKQLAFCPGRDEWLRYDNAVSARIIIVGAGGQGAVVADILQRAREAGGAEPIGFVDDAPALPGATVLDLPVLGPVNMLARHAHDGVIVAVGDNQVRRTLVERLIAAGERLVAAIHPFSCVAPSATIGDGATIGAGAVVAARAVIGRGVIVNTRAAVEHDSIVGDFAHVASGATLGARVRIGEETLIATGAAIVSDVTVGDRTVIGAGAVVVRSIPADVVAFGVPARIKSSRR